jgi:hypothetical protein
MLGWNAPIACRVHHFTGPQTSYVGIYHLEALGCQHSDQVLHVAAPATARKLKGPFYRVAAHRTTLPGQQSSFIIVTFTLAVTRHRKAATRRQRLLQFQL